MSRPLHVHATAVHVTTGVVKPRLLWGDDGSGGLVCLGEGGDGSEGRQGQTCSKTNGKDILQHWIFLPAGVLDPNCLYLFSMPVMT